MAIIPWPAGLRIAEIEWDEDLPAQVNRSQWTGKRSVEVEPLHSLRRAQVTLVPVHGEANVLERRTFLAKLKGVVNSTRIVAVEGDQHSGTLSVVVNSAVSAITSTQLGTSGWPASSTPLLAGRLLTIGEQLVTLTADVVANASGQAVVTFEAALRVLPVNGAAIVTKRPTCLMALSAPSTGWQVGRGQLYGGKTLAFEEVF